MVRKYYLDDDSYISIHRFKILLLNKFAAFFVSDIISLNLVFNIICLLYVKVILNESKQETQIANESESGSLKSDVQSINSALQSISNKARKYSKRNKVAKAFSLDIIWDYILMIFKKRAQSGRLIIILFLAVVLIEKTSPYGE